MRKDTQKKPQQVKEKESRTISYPNIWSILTQWLPELILVQNHIL